MYVILACYYSFMLPFCSIIPPFFWLVPSDLSNISEVEFELVSDPNSTESRTFSTLFRTMILGVRANPD
ncbi:hypothetical protein BDR04DRAFT_1100478 [Suillus decipiens]|nr:hypothetical protein BDR04DRAFT_1100478 [Suillus decipiens]